MSPTTRRTRVDLSDDEARAVYAGLQEALAANLLTLNHADAARELLDRLASKVPSWLEHAPVQGEAGYLLAAQAVLRALIDAQDRGRSALSELELDRALGSAKPPGVSIADVLRRMRRERLLREIPDQQGGPPWRSAAPAGRRLLAARDGAASGEEWRVTDSDALAELIFREHRACSDAFRPAVQAIGRLADPEFEALADDLRVAGLLEPEREDRDWLTLTSRGARFAEERVRESLPRHTFLRELPPPPLPYRRGLPLRADRDDRCCRCRNGHAAWLMPSSKTKLHQTLRRDGAVEWECRWCARRWLVFLLAHLADGVPAFAEPAKGTFVRPFWRPR